MGRHELPKPRRQRRVHRRGRWSPVVAAVVLPAVAFLAAGGAGSVPTRSVTATPCCPELVAAPVAVTPEPGLRIVGTGPTTSTIVAARAVTRDVKYMLPVGVAPEQGLQVETILAARAISAAFPEIHNIGGVRPDALRWHPDGLALDVMIPDYRSPAGKALGDRIAAYALANADRFKINHVIWRQVIYLPGAAPRTMPDYGSDDANHYTHVHVATNGGGYPTGREVYVTSADGPTLVGGTPVNTLIGAH